MSNEEVRSVSSTGGEKGTKPQRMSLLPTDALLKISEHYAKGAEKYSAHNWRRGYEWSKSYDALQRHLLAWWGGEDIDEETGSSHLAAAGFHVLTLLTFIEEQKEFDDRFVPESKAPKEKPKYASGGFLPRVPEDSAYPFFSGGGPSSGSITLSPYSLAHLEKIMSDVHVLGFPRTRSEPRPIKDTPQA